MDVGEFIDRAARAGGARFVGSAIGIRGFSPVRLSMFMFMFMFMFMSFMFESMSMSMSMSMI